MNVNSNIDNGGLHSQRAAAPRYYPTLMLLASTKDRNTGGTGFFLVFPVLLSFLLAGGYTGVLPYPRGTFRKPKVEG